VKKTLLLFASRTERMLAQGLVAVREQNGLLASFSSSITQIITSPPSRRVALRNGLDEIHI